MSPRVVYGFVRIDGRKLARRSAIGVGVLAALLVGVYLYQPQRYDFFPAEPESNPPVDPDTPELFAEGTRVAVVAAHPDDPEFYIGGLLTKLGRSGAKLAIVMCTDGDKAYYPPFLTNVDENRRVRREEQIEAARQYGAEVFFLGKPDGRLRANEELDALVRDRLREFAPEYVLTFDPEYPPRMQHSDHLNAGIAACRVAPEVPSVRWLCRFSTHAPNHVVDISDVWDIKRSLLRIHRSQFAKKIDFIFNLVGSRARADGARIGVEYGEGLRCTKLH